jgi:TonB family protein
MEASVATLGEWQIVERLGEGPVGVVYRVLHQASEKQAALKVIHPHLAEQKHIRDRFLAQAIRPARLEHPHLGLTEALFACGNELCILMRLEAGVSLPLRRSERPVGEVLRQFAAMLEGFEFAHERRFVHGDIKPGNILIGEDGEMRALDLTLRRILGDSLDIREIMGAPGYRSPEQEAGEVLDARSDMYSLAVVLHVLLTGRMPDAGRGQPVPEGLWAVLQKGLARDRAERYGEVREFRAALVDAVEPAAAVILVEPVVLPPSEPPAVRRWWAVAAAIGLLPALWWVLRGSPANNPVVSGPTLPLPLVSETAAGSGATPEETQAAAESEVTQEERPPTPAAVSVVPRRFVPPPSRSSAASAPSMDAAPSVDVGTQVQAHVPRLVLPAPEPRPPVVPPKAAADTPALAALQPPRLVSSPAPRYPAAARQLRIAGTVRLEAIISETGQVQSLRPLSGHAILVSAAIPAVRKWLYEPARMKGRPIVYKTQVEINFAPPAELLP